MRVERWWRSQSGFQPPVHSACRCPGYVTPPVHHQEIFLLSRCHRQLWFCLMVDQNEGSDQRFTVLRRSLPSFALQLRSLEFPLSIKVLFPQIAAWGLEHFPRCLHVLEWVSSCLPLLHEASWICRGLNSYEDVLKPGDTHWKQCLNLREELCGSGAWGQVPWKQSLRKEFESIWLREASEKKGRREAEGTEERARMCSQLKSGLHLIPWGALEHGLWLAPSVGY